MLKKNGAASIGFTIGNSPANVSRKALAMSFRVSSSRSAAAPADGAALLHARQAKH
jgi:hypothetical protein